MKEIGEYLRRTREERNISLKDVQETTKIRMRYLEAIEQGDFNAIPGEVYRKGFLTNYANAIGLNGQEVLQRYYQAKADQEEQLRLSQQTETTVVENTVKTSSQLSFNWSQEVYLGIVGTLIVLLIVFSFFAGPTIKGHSEETAVRGYQNTDVQDTNTDKQIFPAPITVYAEFKQKVWIQVKSDGEYLFEDGLTFDSSEPKQVWTAQRSMVIKVGNPEGVTLSFNGKVLPQIGERGVITTIKLTPKGLAP